MVQVFLHYNARWGPVEKDHNLFQSRLRRNTGDDDDVFSQYVSALSLSGLLYI
jgi:hypothetical protein